ncbi:uncharacterized protein LOC110603997 [Manihot esculenta]|uniref:uncharacterized protein LOC110603997 n=1 Tax=Manihot esculenta TaxID=3983 RepID=UPI000B5D8DCB|nr:uncharacterized protein LOC110603997 [Manihot esculenta]
MELKIDKSYFSLFSAALFGSIVDISIELFLFIWNKIQLNFLFIFSIKEQEEDYSLNDASPIPEEILAETFFKKLKLPSLDKYDGTVDSMSHMAIFRTMMQPQDVNDFILCRVFSSTLTGLAQKWYQHLSLDSIHNFTQLDMLFKYKFIICIPPKKLSSNLQKIRHGEGKSLQSFISHFNFEAMQIEELNHEIACEALKKGIHNIKFMDSLIKNLATTYQQLIDKAQKYIKLDDDVQALREDRKTRQSKAQKLERRGYEGNRKNYLVSRERDKRGKYKTIHH